MKNVIKCDFSIHDVLKTVRLNNSDPVYLLMSLNLHPSMHAIKRNGAPLIRPHRDSLSV